MGSRWRNWSNPVREFKSNAKSRAVPQLSQWTGGSAPIAKFGSNSQFYQRISEAIICCMDRMLRITWLLSICSGLSQFCIWHWKGTFCHPTDPPKRLPSNFPDGWAASLLFSLQSSTNWLMPHFILGTIRQIINGNFSLSRPSVVKFHAIWLPCKQRKCWLTDSGGTFLCFHTDIRLHNRFDLYTKPVEDCRVKTSFGGISEFVGNTHTRHNCIPSQSLWSAFWSLVCFLSPKPGHFWRCKLSSSFTWFAPSKYCLQRIIIPQKGLHQCGSAHWNPFWH